MNEELNKLKRQMEYHAARAEVKIAQLKVEVEELKALLSTPFWVHSGGEQGNLHPNGDKPMWFVPVECERMETEGGGV